MRFGRYTGISFIDSTLIKVCGNLQISNQRVFHGIAGRSKTSTGRMLIESVIDQLKTSVS